MLYAVYMVKRGKTPYPLRIGVHRPQGIHPVLWQTQAGHKFVMGLEKEEPSSERIMVL